MKLLYVHIEKIKPKENVRGTQKEKSDGKAFMFFLKGCFFWYGSKVLGSSISLFFCQLSPLQGAVTVKMKTTANGSGCNYVHTYMDRYIFEMAPVYHKLHLQ